MRSGGKSRGSSVSSSSPTVSSTVTMSGAGGFGSGCEGVVLGSMRPLLVEADREAVKLFTEQYLRYGQDLASKSPPVPIPPLTSMITMEVMEAMPLFLKTLGINCDLPSFGECVSKALVGNATEKEAATRVISAWNDVLVETFRQIVTGTMMDETIKDLTDEEAKNMVKKVVRWDLSAGSFDKSYNRFQQGWYKAMRQFGLRTLYYSSKRDKKRACELIVSLLFPPAFKVHVSTQTHRFKPEAMQDPDMLLHHILSFKDWYSGVTAKSSSVSASISGGTKSKGLSGGSQPKKNHNGEGTSTLVGGTAVRSKTFAVVCYNCQKTGHKSTECTEPRRKREWNPKSESSGSSGGRPSRSTVSGQSATASTKKSASNAVSEAAKKPAGDEERPTGRAVIAGESMTFCLDTGATTVYISEEKALKVATAKRIQEKTVVVEKFAKPKQLTVASENGELTAYYRLTAPVELYFDETRKKVSVKSVQFTVVRGLVEEVLFGNKFIKDVLGINIEDLLRSNRFVTVSSYDDTVADEGVTSLSALLAATKEYTTTVDEDETESVDLMELMAQGRMVAAEDEELEEKVDRIIERKTKDSLPMDFELNDPLKVKQKLDKALEEAGANGMSREGVNSLRSFLYTPEVVEQATTVKATESGDARVSEQATASAELLKDAIGGAYRVELPEVPPKAYGVTEQQLTISPIDAFRLSLSNDPPALVEPIKEQMRDSIYDVKYYQRRYALVSSEFLWQRLSQLAYFGLLYRDTRAVIVSPALTVAKPGVDATAPIFERYRLAIDLRAVNKHTVPVYWPVPNMETFAVKAAGKTCFAVLDMKDGFWLLPLHPETQKFFSIGTDRGVWTSRRLLHGAVNAVAYYQSSMEETLEDLIQDHKLIVYVDDLLIMGANERELVENIIAVVRRLWKKGFKISAKKTIFFAKSVKFCGRIFSESGVKFDTAAVETVLKMKEPVTADELRSYVCTVNWFRLAITRFAEQVAPLQELLRTALQTVKSSKLNKLVSVKLKDIGWSAEHSSAFQKLNKSLAHAAELAYPPTDDAHRVCVYMDASKYHWAAVITVVHKTELDKPHLEQAHKPLAFLSGTFVGSMLKWPTVEKEAFAFREVCERYMWLLKRPDGFLAFTDHKNLVSMFNNVAEAADGRKQAAERLERWMVFLRGFRYDLKHIPGEDNVCADMISRWAAPGIEFQGDEMMEELKAFMLTRAQKKKAGSVAIGATVPRKKPPLKTRTDEFNPGRVASFNIDDGPTEGEIQIAQKLAVEDDDRVVNDEVTSLGLKQTESDGLWRTATGQVWVPNKHCLRVRLCIVAHQSLGGHRGSEVTLKRVAEKFVWKGMRGDVTGFCRACLQCLSIRGGGTIPRPWLGTMKATEPNELLAFDYYYVRASTDSTGDTESEGYVYVLVLRDEFSKYTWLVPARKADAKTTAKALIDWFAAFGIVRKWTSDRGSHFMNAVVQEVSKVLGTEHHFTTPYAPWANGGVERANKELREVMTALMTELLLDEDRWHVMLPVVQHILNQAPSETLGGYAPCEVMTGLKRQSPLDVVLLPTEEQVCKVDLSASEVKVKIEEWRKIAFRIREEVAAVKPREAARAAGAQDVDFGVGDYVLVSSATKQGVSKLKPRWYGPALVKDCVNANTYKVVSVLDIDGEPKDVSAIHLKRYADKDLVLTEELKDHSAYVGFGYNVECFLKHRVNGDSWELFAKWVGYSPEEGTWKRIEDWYTEVPTLVKKYVKTISSNEEREDVLALLKSLD